MLYWKMAICAKKKFNKRKKCFSAKRKKLKIQTLKRKLIKYREKRQQSTGWEELKNIKNNNADNRYYSYWYCYYHEELRWCSCDGPVVLALALAALAKRGVVQSWACGKRWWYRSKRRYFTVTSFPVNKCSRKKLKYIWEFIHYQGWASSSTSSNMEMYHQTRSREGPWKLFQNDLPTDTWRRRTPVDTAGIAG